MEPAASDIDRFLFFELARKNAEATYAKNPLDAENLTRWGGALLELSQFQSAVPDSIKFVRDAISRLEEALEVNPRKADALWCLGNAHTSQGFFSPDTEVANASFQEAIQCFKKALEEEPENALYIKALDLSYKAPELHLELQRQMINQQGAAGGSSASNVKASKKKNSSDLKYDILGWVILAIGIVAWVGMAKSHLPPPPPR